jgi:hypothetical protein
MALRRIIGSISDGAKSMRQRLRGMDSRNFSPVLTRDQLKRHASDGHHLSMTKSLGRRVVAPGHIGFQVSVELTLSQAASSLHQ